jgi:hypothetical protein
VLNAYLSNTRRLLQNPSAPTQLYSDADLTAYINTARGQLSADGQCVRYYASLSTVNTTQIYAFSSINTGVAGTTGIANALSVRMIGVAVAGGQNIIAAWPWEWFNQYYIGTTGISNAIPANWAQYGQGKSGSIYFSPTPNAVYVLSLDCVCTPIDLATDGTVEAIPYPWTDAVPYFAAYLALLSSQTGAREEQANRMFARYEEFRDRARRLSTANVLPYQYDQSGSRTAPSPAGVASPAARGG